MLLHQNSWEVGLYRDSDLAVSRVSKSFKFQNWVVTSGQFLIKSSCGLLFTEIRRASRKKEQGVKGQDSWPTRKLPPMRADSLHQNTPANSAVLGIMFPHMNPREWVQTMATLKLQVHILQINRKSVSRHQTKVSAHITKPLFLLFVWICRWMLCVCGVCVLLCVYVEQKRSTWAQSKHSYLLSHL